jgi:hypothetical protein
MLPHAPDDRHGPTGFSFYPTGFLSCFGHSFLPFGMGMFILCLYVWGVCNFVCFLYKDSQLRISLSL